MFKQKKTWTGLWSADSFHKRFTDMKVICDMCNKTSEDKQLRLCKDNVQFCCCNFQISKRAHKVDRRGRFICCDVCMFVHFVPLNQQENSSDLTCKFCNSSVKITFLGSTYSSLNQLHQEHYNFYDYRTRK